MTSPPVPPHSAPQSATPGSAPLPAANVGALFRRLYGHSQNAVLLTRPGIEFLAANARACAVFGANEATLIELSRGEGYRRLIGPGDPRLPVLVAEREAQGHAQGELRMRRLNGEAFDAQIWSVLFADESGLPTAILVVRDISTLRRAEREARDSEQRLQFALSAAAIGDWDMDLRTNVARRSLQHDRCFGYEQPVAEWGYETFLAHVHEDDRERVDACYRRAMVGAGEYDVEFRVVWPDGSLHWLWSRGRFYFDADGTLDRVAGIQVDVTQRRQTEQALRRSEERLQLAMRGSSDAHWDLDLRTNEPYYSPRWMAMLGYDPQLRMNDPSFWLSLCHPDDLQPMTSGYNEALAGECDTYQLEFRMQHRDGHYVPILSRGYIQRDAQGRAVRVSGTNTDLTERHRLEEAQRHRMLAESANAAKSAFLSRMSHELRTPLNAVLGFSQLLLAHPRQRLLPEQQRQVEQIERAGWHLLHLVDEVLDLSRIDAGRVELRCEAVDTAALLHEAAAMVAGAAAERQVEVQLQRPDSLPQLLGDATRVRQILLNLLSNAIKYTHRGGRVQLLARSEASEVALAVADDGPGLSAEQQAGLFQPFNRLGQESSGTPGTGIGLVISRQLAELMGGRIGVDSAPGHGSVFTLRLPVAPGQPDTVASAAGGVSGIAGIPGVSAAEPPAPWPGQGPAPAPVLPRHRVLCIEDNAANAEVIRAVFSSWPGIALEIQGRGDEGLAAARQRRPDLVLLDMQLPDMNGLAVLAALKADASTARLPVVVVSAAAMRESVLAALDAGADDYLPKPLNLQALAQVVVKTLGLESVPG